MLSVFPDILFLAPLSAFLIRVALALVFLYAGWKHFSHSENSFRYLAVVEFISAISIGAGAKMQIGALVGGCVIFFWLSRANLRPVAKSTALLALVMCISLLVTGSGAIAFDLPL